MNRELDCCEAIYRYRLKGVSFVARGIPTLRNESRNLGKVEVPRPDELHTSNTNLRVRGVCADVVDAPGDLEVEDGVEGVLAAVDNVRRQLHLLPAADDVRPFAERFMRSFIQGLSLTVTPLGPRY